MLKTYKKPKRIREDRASPPGENPSGTLALGRKPRPKRRRRAARPVIRRTEPSKFRETVRKAASGEGVELKEGGKMDFTECKKSGFKMVGNCKEVNKEQAECHFLNDSNDEVLVRLDKETLVEIRLKQGSSPEIDLHFV